jgi:hypothetical protein
MVHCKVSCSQARREREIALGFINVDILNYLISIGTVLKGDRKRPVFDSWQWNPGPLTC